MRRKLTIESCFNGSVLCTHSLRVKSIGNLFPTEKEVWEAALITGLVTDVPVADEEGGKVLPSGYHVELVEETRDPRAPTEILLRRSFS